MLDWRSSLEKCFNGEAFCWNQNPKELYCYKSQVSKGFPKGDTLYKYNATSKKWKISCDGDGICEKGCLVHAYQKRDPEYMDRVYYNVGKVEPHLKHITAMEEWKNNKEN